MIFSRVMITVRLNKKYSRIKFDFIHYLSHWFIQSLIRNDKSPEDRLEHPDFSTRKEQLRISRFLKVLFDPLDSAPSFIGIASTLLMIIVSTINVHTHQWSSFCFLSFVCWCCCFDFFSSPQTPPASVRFSFIASVFRLVQVGDFFEKGVHCRNSEDRFRFSFRIFAKFR